MFFQHVPNRRVGSRPFKGDFAKLERRAAIGNRNARLRLTQEILRAFEPAIRQHLAQWFHFVPVWPDEKPK